MRSNGKLCAVLFLGAILSASSALGQQPSPPVAPPTAAKPNPPPHIVQKFNAASKRAPGDPAQIARGKTIFAINCRGCHGADLRGGDLGGPNLLRSQVALSDQNGELIVPIINGARQKQGMPAIGLSPADALAVAAYVRSVIDTIQGQGAPPDAGREPPSILVGDAREGQAYFAAKCSSCHSPTGDLKGLATKISDPKRLQTDWVAGGGDEDENSPARTPIADITLPSGEHVSGQLEHIDDFLVTVKLADGSERTLRRTGDIPKIVIHDPMKGHRDLWQEYTDKDIHDVTAYLVTLK